MIFDEMYDGMGHMMDWFTPSGELIFLGVISFIIIVIILLLFLLNRDASYEEYLKDTTDTIAPSRKQKEFKPSETTKYCPECGSKMSDPNSKFCPLCGTGL